MRSAQNLEFVVLDIVTKYSLKNAISAQLEDSREDIVDESAPCFKAECSRFMIPREQTVGSRPHAIYNNGPASYLDYSGSGYWKDWRRSLEWRCCSDR